MRNEQRKEEMGSCFHCKKMGHFITDCPFRQATTSKRMHKKKAMVAIWDDTKSEEEEVDTPNVC